MLRNTASRLRVCSVTYVFVRSFTPFRTLLVLFASVGFLFAGRALCSFFQGLSEKNAAHAVRGIFNIKRYKIKRSCCLQGRFCASVGYVFRVKQRRTEKFLQGDLQSVAYPVYGRKFNGVAPCHRNNGGAGTPLKFARAFTVICRSLTN